MWRLCTLESRRGGGRGRGRCRVPAAGAHALSTPVHTVLEQTIFIWNLPKIFESVIRLVRSYIQQHCQGRPVETYNLLVRQAFNIGGGGGLGVSIKKTNAKASITIPQ